MDKQYKLTDIVSKDSIKSPIFKKWVKRILCIACILSLALQLTLCCLPIQASAEENVLGTWVFNDNIIAFGSSTNSVNFDFTIVDNQSRILYGDSLTFVFNQAPFGTFLRATGYYDGNSVSSDVILYAFSSSILDVNVWLNGQTITILSVPDNADFIIWLNANATKVVETVYDFTGETRIFNDELTLFNTSDATWTYAANFNFEVLGVGTADYITLQRTVQNNYTMRYAFDFEGSGGLTMIYRDSPPFNNGEAEWLGGKVNRKVITFLSNPEDPKFQQWLLDNTTLFDNVNDAYQLGQQSGYNNGYEEGFANSLIGDSLSGPINALSQITLIEIQGTAITLGGVVMTAIALCLVLAFLKLYAGG